MSKADLNYERYERGKKKRRRKREDRKSGWKWSM